jgi:hypothetical protein
MYRTLLLHHDDKPVRSESNRNSVFLLRIIIVNLIKIFLHLLVPLQKY